jgi:hypothetical protein
MFFFNGKRISNQDKLYESKRYLKNKNSMTPLFSFLLQKIQEWLEVKAEHKRIKVIKEALQSYGQRRGISLNNNSKGSL